jgi:hypothetical protein
MLYPPAEVRTHARMSRMDDTDLELIDAVLSMALAAGTGDQEALEIFLRASDPADLAVAGADVIWRMATALGQLVDPPRSPPQMIHVFAQALRQPDEFGDAGSS